LKSGRVHDVRTLANKENFFVNEKRSNSNEQRKR